MGVIFGRKKSPSGVFAGDSHNPVSSLLVTNEEERRKREFREWVRKDAKERGIQLREPSDEIPRYERILREYCPGREKTIRQQEHEDAELTRIAEKLEQGGELTDLEKQNAQALLDNLDARGKATISQGVLEMLQRWVSRR